MRCNFGKALVTPEADKERGRDQPEPLAEFKDGGSPQWRLPVLALISVLVSIGFGSGGPALFLGFRRRRRFPAAWSERRGVGRHGVAGLCPVGHVSRVQPVEDR